MGFELTRGTVMEDVDGTTVLLSARGDSAVLNTSADMILNALLSCFDMEAARDRLRDIYDIDLATLVEDVDAVVKKLSDHGMLETTGR